MAWHYKATIADIKLSDMSKKCLDAFGSIKDPAAKKIVLDVIKSDLIQIMNEVVRTSLDYFGRGRSGTMAQSLMQGIQVKGRTPISIEAIIHGVDYTLIHEGDAHLKPKKSQMLAIPLPAACYPDGRPKKVGGPLLWQSYKKTFILSGEKAAKRHRQQKYTEINPHSTSDVAYIAYKDNTRGNKRLVYLYKLVPYSIFKEGYKNANGESLKKLGIEKRLYTALLTAWAGWFNLIASLMTDAKNFNNLKVYSDIKFGEQRVNFNKTWAVPTGSTAGLPRVAMDAAGFVNMAININRS